MSLTDPESPTDAEAALVVDDELALAADAAQSELVVHAAAGDEIRRQADKAQLRLALRDLTSGLRGMIRVAPLASVFVGVAIGVALGKRRSRRAPPRR